MCSCRLVVSWAFHLVFQHHSALPYFSCPHPFFTVSLFAPMSCFFSTAEMWIRPWHGWSTPSNAYSSHQLWSLPRLQGNQESSCSPQLDSRPLTSHSPLAWLQNPDGLTTEVPLSLFLEHLPCRFLGVGPFKSPVASFASQECPGSHPSEMEPSGKTAPHLPVSVEGKEPHFPGCLAPSCTAPSQIWASLLFLRVRPVLPTSCWFSL